MVMRLRLPALASTCNKNRREDSQSPCSNAKGALPPQGPRNRINYGGTCNFILEDCSMADSFNSKSVLTIDNQSYTIHRLDAVYKKYPQAQRLPFSLKILLENLLRTEDGVNVTANDIAALA